jgi:hypothetical protein
MDRKSGVERRKLKRRNLAYYMLVLDASTRQTVGHLLDITPMGLLMDSTKPFPLEKDFRLLLDITPDVANKTTIAFSARSKWCRPDVVEPSLYDIGFSIVGISPGDSAILQRLSEKYSTRDGYNFPKS